MKTRSTTYAQRVMIGWSWLISRHAYVAVAVGLSAGIESGTERTVPDPSRMATTTEIERPQIDAEGYLRFGLAFGK